MKSSKKGGSYSECIAPKVNAEPAKPAPGPSGTFTAEKEYTEKQKMAIVRGYKF